MSTRVNIIYVGGTVARLLPFLHSILVYTKWPLNLVLNGCDEEEARLIETIATAHPDRVEIVVASANRVLAHGVVLDQLLHDEPSPYFCVLDSDVFAAGPVELTELLPTSDLVGTCSCLPIWHTAEDGTMPDGYSIAAGRFIRTAKLEFLGCTYAAAYRVDALRDVVSRYGISLRNVHWDALPSAAQAELDRRSLRLRDYDTLKVANLLIQENGDRLTYVDIPNLIHLGGQSGDGAHLQSRAPNVHRRFRELCGRRMPWLIACVWRARGLNMAESVGLADLARRKVQVATDLTAIGDGTVAFDEAPEWMTDRRTFEAISAILGSR